MNKTVAFAPRTLEIQTGIELWDRIPISRKTPREMLQDTKHS